MKRIAVVVAGLMALDASATFTTAQAPCSYHIYSPAGRLGSDGIPMMNMVASATGYGCPALLTADQPWVHLHFLELLPNYPGEYGVSATIDPNPGPDVRTAIVGTLENGMRFTQLGQIPRRNVAGDFDGDGSADPTVAVFDVGTVWTARTRMAASTSHSATVFSAFGGVGTTRAVIGDFDGDSRSEVAMVDPSTGDWQWAPSAVAVSLDPAHVAAGPSTVVRWGGQATDLPAPADYDGDGITDLAFYRPTDRYWYIRQSLTGTPRYVRWGGGLADEVPVPADYDGDGRADIAFFRPSDRYWYILRSSDGRASYINWGGTVADVPLPGDYDGDGLADAAFYRPSDQYWYIRLTATGAARYAFWGAPGALPTAADYDGDGKTDVAFFRPFDGYWYILNISTGAARYQGWVKDQGSTSFATVTVSR